MRNAKLIFILLLTAILCASTRTFANVFASNVRMTQEGTNAPFDARFTDGTGISIRFVLSDHADSVVATIKLGATVVRNITAKSMSIGDTSIVWDGKDNAGTIVASGVYTLELKAYDKGYSSYTEIAYPNATGLSQRGMTTVNNPALKSFGFIFDVDNGGVQSAVGACRFAANGEPWGNVKDSAKLTSTGITLGPGEARWGTQSDEDGYVYVMGRTAKQVYRFHPDSMNVTIADSGYGAYYPFAIAVRKDAVGKTFAVVTNANSASATLTGDSRILTYHTNSNATYGGAKDTLLKGNGTVMYWDAVFGRDSSLYATFICVGNYPRSGVAKFDLRNKTLPLTLADTVWTARVDSGCVSTLDLQKGAASDGSADMIYFVNARIASGNPPAGQGIYALSNLNNAHPTMVYAYPDKQQNASITRSDVAVDAVGNIVYFENSNEEIALISPPTGANNYTTTATLPVTIINSISISDAIIDANHDFKPDSLGKTLTVIGTVNNVNFQGTASLQYCIQDDKAGIMVFKSGGGSPVFKIGDRIAVTGVIAQYRGTTEITPAAFSDVKLLDSNNVLTPVTLTIPQFYANPEAYESRLIKIQGLAKMPTTVAWPAAGTDANSFMMWNGWDSVLVRLDKDTPIPGSPEPTYPVDVKGVVTQFTSSSTVYNDGYQLSPSLPSDFTQGVSVPPNPHFALVAPAKNTTIKLDSVGQSVTFTWKKAIDLNTGDKLIYQWAPVGGTVVTTGNAGADTMLVRTASQLLTLMAGKDTVTLKWTVKVKDPTNPIVSNVDTASIILVKGTITAVPAVENLLPTNYELSQNYPNPFNPSTMIKFGIPSNAKVTLKVYDVVGREVAELVNTTLAAGYYQYQFNASNLAGGVYFYRIMAIGSVDGKESRFTEVKKLMLLK